MSLAESVSRGTMAGGGNLTTGLRRGPDCVSMKAARHGSASVGSRSAPLRFGGQRGHSPPRQGPLPENTRARLSPQCGPEAACGRPQSRRAGHRPEWRPRGRCGQAARPLGRRPHGWRRGGRPSHSPGDNAVCRAAASVPVTPRGSPIVDPGPSFGPWVTRNTLGTPEKRPLSLSRRCKVAARRSGPRDTPTSRS